MAPDLLSTIRSEIDARLSELRPLLSEYERLAAAAAALVGVVDADIVSALPSSGTQWPARPAEASPSLAQAPPGIEGEPDQPEASEAQLPAEETPRVRERRVRERLLEFPEKPPSFLDQNPVLRRRVEGFRGPEEGKQQPREAAEDENGADASDRRVWSPRPRWHSRRGSAAGTIELAAGPAEEAPAPTFDPIRDGVSVEEPARVRLTPSGIRQAILAALAHGSHTLNELTTVTAIDASEVRTHVRRLAREGKIRRTVREGDGKAAYGLAGAPRA